MTKERFKIGSYVSLILLRDNKILLIRRYQTDFDDGLYGCAGGSIDGDEPILHAMVREAREELGIQLKKEDLTVVHVLHYKKHERCDETVGFYVAARAWDGEPQNSEPHKCDDVAWFALDELPQNTQAHLKQVLEKVNKGVFYSEFGWE